MPKPGERKMQILQCLAEMLEVPKIEKVTTAALAERLECSEAALYRHFASKAQMYEGLIAFIETTLFSLINKISSDTSSGTLQLEHIVTLLLNFAERNKGMTRVLTGDALVHEKERLQERVNLLLDRLEASLKQALRIGATQGEVPEAVDIGALANLIMCYVIGHWQQFAKSGFRKTPLTHWQKQWAMLRLLFQKGPSFQ